mgnify:CR=1 FL=1
MAGRTGYTPITNASAMLGPAQITAVYEHFDPLVDGSRLDATGLPSTGNWQGRTLFLEDTKTVVVWDGAAWIRFDTQWISYTPTRVNNSGGTLTAKYFRTGKKVDVIIRLVGGTISANNPSFTLPFASADSTPQHFPGTVLMRDDSAGVELSGIARRNNSTTVIPYVLAASTPYAQFATINDTVPFTWAAADVLELAFSYEIP